MAKEIFMKHFKPAFAASLLLFGTVATAQQVSAPAGQYASEITHTSVTFRIRHMGLAYYTARFKQMDAVLDFDPANVERSRISASVDLASVETDYQNKDKDWNDELRNDKRFFNASIFPKARFVSTRVRRTGPTTALIVGDLTFLGVTRPMTLNATYNGAFASHPFAKVPALGFSARGKMKRSLWGLDYGIGKDLDDEVELIIETEFLRKGPAT